MINQKSQSSKRFLRLVILFAGIGTLGLNACSRDNHPVQQAPVNSKASNNTPQPFLPGHTPKDHLVHRGVMSVDGSRYYFTISDRQFQNFHIMVSTQEDGTWNPPAPAAFNSKHNDHGQFITADGKQVYFCSTRPVAGFDVADAWHLWRSNWEDGNWTDPEYVDIPNLRDKSTSHPVMTLDGELYFHSSDPDYSNMDLYVAQWQDGAFTKAKRVKLGVGADYDKCTPYVSPKGDYLVFAKVGDPLQLMLTRRMSADVWEEPQELPDTVNVLGQGNPWVSPDGKQLYYATGSLPENGKPTDWQIMRVALPFER